MVDINKYLDIESPGPGPFASQSQGMVPNERIIAGQSEEEAPMPGVMQKLGLGFIPRKAKDIRQTMWEKMGIAQPKTAEEMDRPTEASLLSKVAAMALPNIRDNAESLTTKGVMPAVRGLGEAVIKGTAEIPMGEAPEETVRKASEGDPMTIGMLGLMGGGGRVVSPILKGGLKTIGKGAELLNTNPIAKKWGYAVDKGWSNAVNYLTMPEKSLLADTRLPQQFKDYAANVMTPVQRGGEFLRKHLQPAVERLNPSAQSIIRKAKADASVLVAEEERVGGMLANPEFGLKDKRDFFKIMRGSSMRGASPRVKELVRESRDRMSSAGVDPILLKTFNEKKAALYTKMLDAPQDVLSSRHTKTLMETIDSSIPDGTWFKQGKVRKAISDAISDPGTSDAEAKLLKEMFQLPATTPEVAMEASHVAMNAALKKNLLSLKGPEQMISAPGMKPPPGWVPATWKDMAKEGYYMHPDLALELDSYYKIQNNAKGVFSKYFTSPWKTMKIIMSPAAQIRNIFTNFMLNDIGGLPAWRLDIYRQAVAGMAKSHDTWKDFSRLTGGGGTFSHNELSQLSTAWKYNTEWYDMPNKVLEKASKYPKEFYNANEQVFKYAKYLHNIEKGMGKAEAAADAVIPTFNYSEITPFVSFARSHLMPFATWTSKVIPYTFEMAVKHPIRVGKWFAMYEGLQTYALQQAGMSEEEWQEYKKQWPDYMKKGVYMLMPWRDSRDRLNMVDLTYMVPGIGDMREMTGKGIWGSMFQHPAITLSSDLLTGRTFTGEPFRYDWQSPVMRRYKDIQHVWQAAMPSWFGPWGTDYKKYMKVLSEQPGAMTMGQAIASQFGAKMQPLDDEMIQRLHNSMQRIHLTEMTNEMNKELRMAGGDDEERDKILNKYAEIRQAFMMEEAGIEPEE